MKSFIQAVVATALVAPVVSFAQQSNGPVTREQVRAELVQLAKAGYNPANANTVARLPASHGKLVRMLQSLRTNQFASFTE